MVHLAHPKFVRSTLQPALGGEEGERELSMLLRYLYYQSLHLRPTQRQIDVEETL